MTSAADGDTAVSEPVRDTGPRAAPPAAPASIFTRSPDAAEVDVEVAAGIEAEVEVEADTEPESEADAAPVDEFHEQELDDQPRDGLDEALFPETGTPPVAPPAPPAAAVPEPVPEGPPTARLAQLGITVSQPPAPVAAYVPAVRTGDLVFTSGQLPFVDGSLPSTGTVGDLDLDISPDEASVLARQCAVNALAAVAGVVDLDSVVRVVKVVVYVASAPGFAGQPQVADGASTLLEQVFGEAGRHARSAVGVSALPLRSPVEVEVVVQVAD